jgi:putative ABC transport system permease protein
MMWQIFSNFVLAHVCWFGMLKMLGVSSSSLIKMVLFQAAVIGGLGYILGLILTASFGIIFYDTTIAFHLTWQIVLLGALGSAVIIVFSSYFGILRVLRLDTVELCRDSN